MFIMHIQFYNGLLYNSNTFEKLDDRFHNLLHLGVS